LTYPPFHPLLPCSCCGVYGLPLGLGSEPELLRQLADQCVENFKAALEKMLS
jgi:hypothetical protein